MKDLNINKKYLYLITPTSILVNNKKFKNFLIILDEILKTKKIKFLQLRLKKKNKNLVLYCLKKINFICKKYKVITFINDYVNNEILNFCDGVHLGQKDITKKKINLITNKKKLLGISCNNSKNFVNKSIIYNPNYISFGSFFKTKTKKTKYIASLKNINWFKKKFDIPCAVIGGINLNNINKILETDFNLLAVCSGIWDYKDGPVEAVNLIYKLLNKKK
tara:strand:- start:2394 stop:3053 length:660 start_codon:yes stop_codon:yes gene_type:complete